MYSLTQFSYTTTEHRVSKVYWDYGDSYNTENTRAIHKNQWDFVTHWLIINSQVNNKARCLFTLHSSVRPSRSTSSASVRSPRWHRVRWTHAVLAHIWRQLKKRKMRNKNMNKPLIQLERNSEKSPQSTHKTVKLDGEIDGTSEKEEGLVSWLETYQSGILPGSGCRFAHSLPLAL